MEPATVAVYERAARRWQARRRPDALDQAESLREAVPAGAVRADLGCGVGFHARELGAPVVAMDAAGAMLELTREKVPSAWCVQADLEALAFRRGALAGVWASKSYLHVPRTRLPLALADLHRALQPGAPLHLVLVRGNAEAVRHDDPDFPGRLFVAWESETLRPVLEGAGFRVEWIDAGDRWLHVRARRERTLPDTVGPGMRLLLVGLNPSVYAADAGVGFARPGNRFWPAALAAGIVTRDRDPRHALEAHGIGMTDLVKRATTRASELRRDEYRAGTARLETLVRWLGPGAVCFVGLTGHRAAVDRRAQPGAQRLRFADRPTYVMPSPSGLNARTSLAELTRHLRAAARLGDQATSSAVLRSIEPRHSR